MKPFEKCPVCGGRLETRQVSKVLSGGGNTASLKIIAEVCQRCGEHLYTADMVRSFEKIRGKLQRQEFTQLRSLGQSFTVAEDWPDEDIRPVQ